jgi:acetolactate synthase-1/2/3 large subunit
MGTDAFQEIDVFGVTLPIVKHSFLVRDAADIPKIFAEAFELAKRGRPGPVLIDCQKTSPRRLRRSPRWIRRPGRPCQRAFPPASDGAGGSPDRPGRAARAVYRRRRRPGGRGRRAAALFRPHAGIPAVATLKGLGALPTETTGFLGMLGMHGTKAANLAVNESDLLICVGARFDDRATGKLDTFAPRPGSFTLTWTRRKSPSCATRMWG